MQELINDVINDLADGRITKAEAEERVARIMSACEKPAQRGWVSLSPMPWPYPARDREPTPSQWPLVTWSIGNSIPTP